MSSKVFLKKKREKKKKKKKKKREKEKSLARFCDGVLRRRSCC
jgi:hypothetical protein